MPSYSWHEGDLVSALMVRALLAADVSLSATAHPCPCESTFLSLSRALLHILTGVVQTSIDNEPPQPSPDSEEKVLVKIASFFGILEQLGFTRERIEECLRAVNQLELDDVFDWVRLARLST